MARNDSGAAGSIITAFALGAVAGAAAALLMAPASGDEMRRNLAGKAREGVDKAAEAAKQAREFAEKHRGTVSTAIERGREAYQQARGVTTPAPGGEPL